MYCWWYELSRIKWCKEQHGYIQSNINKEIILSSLESNFVDIEDSIRYNSAVYSWCDYVITRNIKDFWNWNWIKIVTPKEFLSNYL